MFTTDTSDDRNYAYLSGENLPDAVIIDPELTRNLPARITADAGIDALTHAIEAYTSSRANLVTDMYASAAIKLVVASLGPAYAKGSLRMEDRYRLSIASAMAMLAGSVGGVGIAHFMNHALHHKKIPLSHGAKVGLLLPYVMEYNLISDPEKFAEVARLLGENTRGLSTMDAALKSVAAVRRLLSDLGVPQRLSECRRHRSRHPRLGRRAHDLPGRSYGPAEPPGCRAQGGRGDLPEGALALRRVQPRASRSLPGGSPMYLPSGSRKIFPGSPGSWANQSGQLLGNSSRHCHCSPKSSAFIPG